ncbi:hypothetical protein LJK88_15390 [Paenibacillus sp. P26]|nr:hypothetical protein LJK88_15390 [Paenibacillus sp. P26]
MQGKKPLLIFMILSLLFSMLPLSTASAATGMPDSITISDPRGMAYFDGYIYVAQRSQGKISRISTATGQVSDVVSAGAINSAMAVAVNSNGDLFYTRDSDQTVHKIPAASLTNLPLSAAQVSGLSQSYFTGSLNYIYGLAFDTNDNLYLTDYTSKGIYESPQGQTNPVPIITNAAQSILGIGFSLGGDLYYLNRSYQIFKIAQADLTVKAATDPTKAQLMETPSPSANGIVFLPDGSHYLSSLSTGTIYKHAFAREAIAADQKLDPGILYGGGRRGYEFPDLFKRLARYGRDRSYAYAHVHQRECGFKWSHHLYWDGGNRKCDGHCD